MLMWKPLVAENIFYPASSMRRKMGSWNENWLVKQPQCWVIKHRKKGVIGSNPTVVGFMTHTQGQRQVFGNGAGGGITWSHQFSLRRFFFHLHRETVYFLNIQEVITGSTTFFKTRARFWPGSPREMTKPSLSPKQVGGSIRGVPWSHRFSAWRFFFFICTEKLCTF